MNDEVKETIRGLLEAAIAGTESTIRTRNHHGLRAFATSEEEWLRRYRVALAAIAEVNAEAEWVPLGDGWYDEHDLLRAMVARLRPTWYYEMGKTGYECPYCKDMFELQGDFFGGKHRRSCPYAEARDWLYANGPLKIRESKAQDGTP